MIIYICRGAYTPIALFWRTNELEFDLKINGACFRVMTMLSIYSSNQVPGRPDPQSPCYYNLHCNVQTSLVLITTTYCTLRHKYHRPILPWRISESILNTWAYRAIVSAYITGDSIRDHRIKISVWREKKNTDRSKGWSCSSIF